MTVESNYVIAIIAAISDWLKRLAPVFQPMRRKTKTNRTMYAWFFPRFERVTGNCYYYYTQTLYQAVSGADSRRAFNQLVIGLSLRYTVI